MAFLFHRDDFLNRVKENARLKQEARAKGETVNLKRQPAQPRTAHTVKVTEENKPQTIGPIPYGQLWPQYLDLALHANISRPWQKPTSKVDVDCSWIDGFAYGKGARSNVRAYHRILNVPCFLTLVQS